MNIVVLDKIRTTLPKIAKKTILPLTFLTAVAFPQISNAQNAPSAQDTLWGSGIVIARNIATQSGIKNTKITMRAQDMQQVIPETEYEYNTATDNYIEFNVPVYIDLNVGANEYSNPTNTQIYPSMGSEINASFSENTKGVLTLYSISGKKVLEEDFNTDHFYKNLETLPSAAYIYTIKTTNEQSSGKFVKTNTPANGFSQKLPQTKSFQTKNSEKLEDMIATYQIIAEKEGYYPDTSYLEINEGNNMFSIVHMTALPTLPINQDISGIVMDGNNNKEPMANVMIVLEHDQTDDVYGTITDDLGHFIINNLPVQIGSGPEQTYKLSIGGIDGKYSWKEIEYRAPRYLTDSWTATDTINDNFHAILYDKMSETSADHIRDQTSNGFLGDTVFYYLDNSFNATQKANIRGYFEQLKIDENDIFNFTESPNQLENTGINISYGNPTTTPNTTNYETPIGTLHPNLFSTTTMGGNENQYTIFTHETKRAVNLNGVAWPEAESVMEDYATHYTEEDKLIGMFERNYWNEVYQNNSTYIDLNNLAEDIDSKLELLEAKGITPYQQTSTANDVEINYDYNNK